jgi:glycosyltransferase involved in cell wall biosynthesis
LVHVHALFSYASTAAMFICRWKGKPYLNSPHGLLCTWSLQQSASRKRAYLAVIERANLNGSRGLEFATEQEREEAAPLALRAPSFVLPFGLHLPALIPDARRLLRQKYGLPEDSFVILFLSRLHPKKGLDLLLDALETMSDVDFTFIVAGSGEPDYESALRSRIQQSPLSDRVLMTGFASGADKDLLLQGADVFALTSHSESLGIVVLEALAAGVPVVLTPAVPLSPMVREHGLGAVTEMDADKIAATLRNFLQTPRTESDATRAREFVQANFTWDVIARYSSQVYASLLGGQPTISWKAGATV